LLLPFAEGGITHVSCSVGRVVERILYGSFRKVGVRLVDIILALAGFQHFQHLPNHDPGAAKNRLAMGHIRVNNDASPDIHVAFEYTEQWRLRQWLEIPRLLDPFDPTPPCGLCGAG